MYVTVAENGAFGVAVGVGVSEGVMIENTVAVGGTVNVGTSVGVIVAFIGVTVHVGLSWICVIVAVGGWLAAIFAGLKGLIFEFGARKTATKYKPMQNVMSKVKMLNMSHRSRRGLCVGSGE